MLSKALTATTCPRCLQAEGGWCPVYANAAQTLKVMSIGFLTANEDDAVVWRGPKKTSMVKQFLADVVWGDVSHPGLGYVACSP